MSDQLSMFTPKGQTLEVAPGLVDTLSEQESRGPEPLPRLAGNPEEDAKDAVLGAMSWKHRDLLGELRQAMYTLWQKRRKHQGAAAYVTADDARVILDADTTLPPDLNKNFMGSLFKGKQWEPTGEQVKSKTPGSHANRLMCWRWVGDRD